MIRVAISIFAVLIGASVMARASKQQLAPVIKFDASQRAVFQDKSRIIAVNFHRQKGKDFVAAAKAIDESMQTGQDWFIVGLTQGQADETFLKCKRVIDAMKLLLKKKFGVDELREETEEFDEFDKQLNQTFRRRSRTLFMPNGGRVVSLPGRDPDALAGRSGNMIWTEFGLWPKGGCAHWSTLFPIINRKGYKIVIISTPRGRNTRFYEVMQNEEGLYSTHTCDIYRSVFEEGYQLFDPKGNPFPQRTREEQELAIATFRKMYNDEGKWAREYECKFTGDLSALITWAEIERAAALGAGLPFDFIRIDGERPVGDLFVAVKTELSAGARVEVGWDVARRGHLSSVALNLARTNKPKHLRFNVLLSNSPFDTQREFVRACMDLQRWSVGRGDSTGLGMESNETLERMYKDRWEGFTFTSSGKREIASSLKTAFVDGTQTLPSLSGPGKYVATDLYAIQKDDTGPNLDLDESSNPLLEESHCDVGYSVGLARVAGAQNTRLPLPPSRARKPIGM